MIEDTDIYIRFQHPEDEPSYVCLGVRSIVHCNVLGEKNYFSVHSARRVAIFGRDDLDPLNIDANLFLDPLDPPYMSKNDKMCHF